MNRNRAPVLVRRLDGADTAFLRGVARAERRRTRTGVTGWLLRRGARAGTRSGLWLRRVATLALLLVAAGGLVAGASPASADLLEPNTWCSRKWFAPDRADEGLVGELLKAEYADRRGRGDPPSTKWAQYGTAGTDWSTYWMDCLDYRRVVNEAANAVFGIARELSAIAIALFMWTFKGELLDVFLAKDDRVAGSRATLDNFIQQAHFHVYLQLFAVATLIGATVLAWRWLFSRASASDVLGKFGWMVLVAGLATVYGGVPGGPGPQAATILKTVNDWTNDITAVVLAAFATIDCETPGLRTSGQDSAEQSLRHRDMALECAAENMYEVMIYTPWAIGMIGKYDRAPRSADGKRGQPTEDQLLAVRILKQKAYSFNDITANGNDPNAYTDARGRNGRMKVDICTGIPEAERPPNTYTGKSCDRATMRQRVFGVLDDQLTPAEKEWGEVRATGNQNYWEHWSGGKADNRFNVAVLALIGSTSIALIIIFVSFAYLTLQIGTIMFALMAPVAFLLGLIPGFGVRVFLRWLELLLGTFIKRIVLGLFVGLLVALYNVVLTIAMPWLMKLILVCTIAMFGLIYRKRFTDAFALNLSGSDAFHRDGDLAGRVKDAGTAAIGGTIASRQMGQRGITGAFYGAARASAPSALREAYDIRISNLRNRQR
jgi:hypothetical protein